MTSVLSEAAKLKLIRTPLAIGILTALVTVACGQGPTFDGKSGVDDNLASSEQKVVYGTYSRKDYGALDAKSKSLVDRTAMFVTYGGSAQGITCAGDSCTLVTAPYLTHYINVAGANPEWLQLCTSQPFKGQQKIVDAAAKCSGFLVAPDLLATAKHCVDGFLGVLCPDWKIVFGFYADANGRNEVVTVPSSQVYQCTQVVAQGISVGTDDWAVVRVDRAVTGLSPLMVRYSGNIALGASVTMAGSPEGLPMKFVDQAYVKQNDLLQNRFFSSLDSMSGLSGGPVFDATTGNVEGIHATSAVSSNDAWQIDVSNGGRCAKESVCSDVTGCPNGTDTPWGSHTRITRASTYIPLHSALVMAMQSI